MVLYDLQLCVYRPYTYNRILLVYTTDQFFSLIIIVTLNIDISFLVLFTWYSGKFTERPIQFKLIGTLVITKSDCHYNIVTDGDHLYSITLLSADTKMPKLTVHRLNPANNWEVVSSTECQDRIMETMFVYNHILYIFCVNPYPTVINGSVSLNDLQLYILYHFRISVRVYRAWPGWIIYYLTQNNVWFWILLIALKKENEELIWETFCNREEKEEKKFFKLPRV